MYIINNNTFILLIINYKINKILNILNKNTYYKIKLNKVFLKADRLTCTEKYNY